MKKLIFGLIFIPVLLLGQTTYYVSDQGNNSDNGTTLTTAFLTVDHAASTATTPGDIILIFTGDVFRETVTMDGSGTLGNPITVSVIDSATGLTGSAALALGDTATISGTNIGVGWTNISGNKWYKTGISGNPEHIFINGTRGTEAANSAAVDTQDEWFWTTAGDDTIFIFSTDTTLIEYGARWKLIDINNKDYVIIDNINLIKSTQRGITVADGSDNIIISNCTISDSYQWAIIVEATVTSNNDGRITNCTINNNNATGIAFTRKFRGWQIDSNTVYDNCELTGTGPFIDNAGIKLWGNSADGDSCIIEYNEIYNNGSNGQASRHGHGLWIDETRGNHILRYNDIHGNNSKGVTIEADSSNQIYCNKIHNHVLPEGAGEGIALSRQCDSNVIYNNSLYNNRWGIALVGTNDAGITKITDNLIKNNICFEGIDGALKTHHGGDNEAEEGSGNVYSYNCFGPQESNFIEWGSGVYISTYAVFEDSVGSATNSIAGDPLFIDAANDDFTLRPLSPCIDNGIDVGLVRDFNNDILYGIPDIGAFEYIPPEKGFETFLRFDVIIR